jgi:hypothetical protein
MTIWWILLICLALTILAFFKNNIILSVVAGLSWFVLLAYTRTIPFATIAVGSTVDQILMGIYSGMALTIWLNQFRVSWNGRTKEEPSKYEQEASNNKMRHGARTNGVETPEEYQEKLRAASRHNRR